MIKCKECNGKCYTSPCSKCRLREEKKSWRKKSIEKKVTIKQPVKVKQYKDYLEDEAKRVNKEAKLSLTKRLIEEKQERDKNKITLRISRGNF